MPRPSPRRPAAPGTRGDRFLTAVAGNLAGYEEALRALFAGDRRRFDTLIRDWPPDVNFFAMTLSQDAFAERA